MMRARLGGAVWLLAMSGCADRVIVDQQGLVLDTDTDTDFGTGSSGFATDSASGDDTFEPATTDGPCSPGEPGCECPPGQVPSGEGCVVAVADEMVAVVPPSQSAFAGDVVPQAPAVQLLSAGEPVPGVSVQFSTAGLGGGVLGVTEAITDQDGIASVDSWTLGKLDGVYFARAAVGSVPTLTPVDFAGQTISDFDIVLHFVNPPTDAQLAAFEFSRLRWQAALINALPAINGTVGEFASECGVDFSGGAASITGVHIFVQLQEIDGPGGDNGNILGQAGPCALRDDGSPYVGVMTFDTFDLDELQASGSLETVILHEMGHVLGVGSLWGFEGLLQNPSIPNNAGADTFFTGSRATAVFNQLLGAQMYPGAIVPVENNAQPGSSDSHWRETVMVDELMSPRLGGPGEVAPMSALTIGSMGDLGFFEPNELAADAWQVPPLGLVGPSDEDSGHHGYDEVLRPRWIRTEDGERIPLP